MSTEVKTWISIQPGYNGQLLVPVEIFVKLVDTGFHVVNERYISEKSCSVTEIDVTPATMKLYTDEQIKTMLVRSRLLESETSA